MSTPLGEFLRARRDATTPESLGLPSGARRRAPGIRRSELATLAGVSVEYLTRIEQGRDRNPSPHIVRALADALELDTGEREHLRHLTKITAGACTAGSTSEPQQPVRQSILAMLGQFGPGIAFVTNRAGDILAATRTFEILVEATGLLDVDNPNLTRFVFTDKRAKTVFRDWDQVADEQAFDLWTANSPDIVDQLSAQAGVSLTSRLNGNRVPSRGRIRWRHPIAGELTFEREMLQLSASDGQQFVVYLAADRATEAAVRRLGEGDGRPLRAVN